MYKQILLPIIAIILLASCQKEEYITISTAIGATEVNALSATLTVSAEASTENDCEWGVVYSLDPNPRLDYNNFTSSGEFSNSLTYSVSVSDLTPKTTYYAQAWCRYEGHRYFGEEVISFTTDSLLAAGEATITGTVHMEYDISDWNGPPPPNQIMEAISGNIAEVSWSYTTNIGPFGNINDTEYEMAVDLNDGTYTLTVPTEGLGGNAVNVDFGILDFVGTRVGNNALMTADSTVSGTYSMGGQAFSASLYNGDVINQDFDLNFTP